MFSKATQKDQKYKYQFTTFQNDFLKKIAFLKSSDIGCKVIFIFGLFQWPLKTFLVKLIQCWWVGRFEGLTYG